MEQHADDMLSGKCEGHVLNGLLQIHLWHVALKWYCQCNSDICFPGKYVPSNTCSQGGMCSRYTSSEMITIFFCTHTLW